MAAPSEQISQRWIEGAVRECRECGVKITNLAKQVGEVRTVFPSRRREILCLDCHLGKIDRLVERTRRGLGLQETKENP